MLHRFKNLARELEIQIRAPGRAPYSFRLTTHELILGLSVVGTLWLFTATGTLFFFREVEINRKVMEKVLELETGLLLNVPNRSLIAQPEVKIEPEKELIREPTAVTSEISPELTVNAKLHELIAECSETSCTVSTILTPASHGIAKGSLSMVLEAIVPRIGGADPNAPNRAQFIYYPGLEVLDQFDPEKAVTLQKRQFKFSRALPTRVEFTIGKLHRPIAINLYLFDASNNLIGHERKTLSHD